MALSAPLLEPVRAREFLQLLEPDYFETERLRSVCRAMHWMVEHDEPVDPALLIDRLTPELQDDARDAISELLEAGVTTGNFLHHARYIKAAAVRRDLLRALSVELSDGTLPLDDVLLRTQAHITELQQNGAVLPSLEVMGGLTLFATPSAPPAPLVDRLIYKHRQGIIFGTPGLGKSQITRAIGNAVALGERVFERYRTEQGRVLYVLGEETEDDVRRSIAITTAGADFALDRVLQQSYFVFTRSSDFTLSEPRDRLKLEKTVADLQPALVVIDTLSAAAGATDLMSADAVKPLLRWGAHLTSSQATTLLWVGHDKKNDQETSDLNALFGSRENSARMDFAYRLKRNGSNLLLVCAKMRGAALPDPVLLQVICKPDELLAYTAISASEADMRAGDVIAAIESYLTTFPGSTARETRDAVARNCAKRSEEIGSVLNRLMAEGRVKNDGTDRHFKLLWV